MSILVLSDTHGMVYEVKQVVDRHQAELVLHCGDFCVDRGKAPFSGMKLVRGNCDFDTEAPKELITEWGELKIFQTHGHLYGVKKSLLQLRYRAEEVGANVVLFGHSHLPVCLQEQGVLFVNPGSLQMPRGFEVPTYALLEQLSATDDHVEVEVRFHDHHGRLVTTLGGRFALRR